MTSKEFIDIKKRKWNASTIGLIVFGERKAQNSDLANFLDEYARDYAVSVLQELTNSSSLTDEECRYDGSLLLRKRISEAIDRIRSGEANK